MLTSIFTIGYGGKKPEEFFCELEQLKPDVVVDVRENPYRAFLSVYTFPQLTKRLGSKYVWIQELGNKNRIMPPTLVDEEIGMSRLRDLAKKHKRIVLLCAEKQEDNCHRGVIKKRFLQLYPDLTTHSDTT